MGGRAGEGGRGRGGREGGKLPEGRSCQWSKSSKKRPGSFHGSLGRVSSKSKQAFRTAKVWPFGLR